MTVVRLSTQPGGSVNVFVPSFWNRPFGNKPSITVDRNGGLFSPSPNHWGLTPLLVATIGCQREPSANTQSNSPFGITPLTSLFTLSEPGREATSGAALLEPQPLSKKYTDRAPVRGMVTKGMVTFKAYPSPRGGRSRKDNGKTTDLRDDEPQTALNPTAQMMCVHPSQRAVTSNFHPSLLSDSRGATTSRARNSTMWTSMIQ